MMTLEKAVEQAEKFTEGETFHAGSVGWKTVMAVLLAEVKRNEYAGLNRTILTLSHDLADENKRAQDLKQVINHFLESVEISEAPSLSFAGWMIIEEMYRKAGRKIPCTMKGLRGAFPEPDPCRCPACQIAEEVNEIKGPLPAAIIADTADAIADELSKFADELNIHHVKYETDSYIIKTYVNWFLSIAKQLRTERIEVNWEDSQK